MESLINPAKNIKLPNGSNSRDRRLHTDEEKYLLKALRFGSQPIAASILQLALETAMRQSEILRLTWEYIDFTRRIVFLPDTKNGQSRTVPLSTKAIVLLNALPRPIDDGKIFSISQDRLIRTFQRVCMIWKRPIHSSLC